VSVSDAVREFVRRTGLTQQAVAVQLGLSLRSVAHYVSGTRSPTVQALIGLATAAREAGFEDLADVFSKELQTQLVGIGGLNLRGERDSPNEPLKYSLLLKPKTPEQKFLVDALLLVLRTDVYPREKAAILKALREPLLAREALENFGLNEKRKVTKLLSEGIPWHEVAKKTALNPGAVLFLHVSGLFQEEGKE
jgi:transcriptional regulator with XRE-family HTH domain